MKFGVREICDVVLRAKARQQVGNKIFYKNEPVIYFDTLKTSSLEGAATTVYAQGGRGNARLMAWEGERTVTFTMEDALISPEGFMILSGAGLIEASEDATIKQHVTESVDEANIKIEDGKATIVLSQKPYLPADKGDNFAYVGRTIDPHKRDRQHRRPHHSHGMNRIGGVLQHSIDTGIDIPEMTILESELNLQESCCQEDFWLQEYRKRGYTMLNKGVTGEFVGSIGGFKAKWTKDMVIEFAKQYPNYADLLRANQSMKYLLKKFNLLDELYPNRLRAHKFTFEEVKEVASKYPTRTRFQKGSPRYYYAASKNKWLDALYPKSYGD